MMKRFLLQMSVTMLWRAIPTARSWTSTRPIASKPFLWSIRQAHISINFDPGRLGFKLKFICLKTKSKFVFASQPILFSNFQDADTIFWKKCFAYYMLAAASTFTISLERSGSVPNVTDPEHWGVHTYCFDIGVPALVHSPPLPPFFTDICCFRNYYALLISTILFVVLQKAIFYMKHIRYYRPQKREERLCQGWDCRIVCGYLWIC
jgi:hypothetical protein